MKTPKGIGLQGPNDKLGLQYSPRPKKLYKQSIQFLSSVIFDKWGSH